MIGLLHLLQRNNKLFRRDRTQVFFSLLSVFIVLFLYILFLQKSQLDAIESMIPMTSGVKILVNEWMVAGILSIMGVTTTLGALGLYVRDREEGVFLDLLTTPMRALQLQLSYVINAWIIGMAFSLIGLALCEVFIVATGGDVLAFPAMLKVIGFLALGVTASSAMNCVLILFTNRQSSFSTLGTIVGTAIGFFCGVYVPIGVLPEFVQKIITAFPISHYTSLLRQEMMGDSLETVFTEAVVRSEYEKIFGVVFEWQGGILSSSMSISYLIFSIIVF